MSLPKFPEPGSGNHPDDWAGDAPRDIPHETNVNPLPPAFGDSELMDAVEAHLSPYLGIAQTVFHEHDSKLVHIDVHRVNPSELCPNTVLYTTGMSELPMHMPEDFDGPAHAELLAVLPPDWGFSDNPRHPSMHPVRALNQLARLPHISETWLGFGHSASPAECTGDFVAEMLIPPYMFPPEIHQLVLPDRHILFWLVVPLYAEELELKKQRGADDLIDLLWDAFDLADAWNPGRPNVAR